MNLELLIDVPSEKWTASEPPEGVSVRGPFPVERYQLAEAAAISRLIVQIGDVAGATIAIGTVAKWIYENLHKHGCKLATIDDQHVDVALVKIELFIRAKADQQYRQQIEQREKEDIQSATAAPLSPSPNDSEHDPPQIPKNT